MEHDEIPPPATDAQAVPPELPVKRPGSFDDLPLIDELWTEPYRFEFFAALRVLARVAANSGALRDDHRSILDLIRFRSHQSLSFPASELFDIEQDPRGKFMATLTVAFMGLTGPLGALPRPYSELVMQRVQKKDYALRDFLDQFNQRLIQIFAQAGEKYRFYFRYEKAADREEMRRAQGPQKLRGFLIEERSRIDLFSQILLDATGLGTPLLRYKDSVRQQPAPRMEVADSTVRFFSGLLSQTHRNAVGLGQAVAEYFGVPAEIISFVGQWVQLPVEHQTCMRRKDATPMLGGAPRSGTCADPRLGRNTVVGSRIWELQGRFRVRLGPLTFDQFKEYLPVGGRYKVLAHLARVYAGPTFDFDIQPVLQGPEVPWCQLGAPGSLAPRLGWNTWLRNRGFNEPIDDAIFPVPDQVSMGA